MDDRLYIAAPACLGLERSDGGPRRLGPVLSPLLSLGRDSKRCSSPGTKCQTADGTCFICTCCATLTVTSDKFDRSDLSLWQGVKVKLLKLITG